MTITRQFIVLSDEKPKNQMLKVGFCTSDGAVVDQHFGAASAIAVFGINPEQSCLLVMTEFGPLSQDANEDKLVDKLALLKGCIAVYCRACGASAVRQLLGIQVQPVKVTEDARIQDLILALQEELRAGPSAWLAKAIQRHKGVMTERFDEMEAEGWQD